MGRTAAPAPLRLLNGRSEGTDSGGRKVTPPPAFRRVAPNPPTWLSREARAEWKRVIPELTRLDLIKEEDRASLAAYCETWATYVDALKTVRRDGVTITQVSKRDGVETTRVVKHPAMFVVERHSQQLRMWATEFGLTPSSEGKLVEEGGRGEQTPLDDDDNPYA